MQTSRLLEEIYDSIKSRRHYETIYFSFKTCKAATIPHLHTCCKCAHIFSAKRHLKNKGRLATTSRWLGGCTDMVYDMWDGWISCRDRSRFSIILFFSFFFLFSSPAICSRVCNSDKSIFQGFGTILRAELKSSSPHQQ